MHPKHLNELTAVESSYWWHITKRELATQILLRRFKPPARLIEGGVGGGKNLLTFQELGYQVTGFDIMQDAVDHCRKLEIDDVRVHDLEKPWPVKSGSVKVIVLLDVLEHLADPVRALRNAAVTLDNKGGIVVTVPACPFLRGPWDQALGHHRRYSTRLLKAHALAAGLRVVWVSYWNAFSLPAAVLVRAAQTLFRCKVATEFPPVPPWLNSFLINCGRVERRVIKKVPIPFGLSLIGVMSK